MYACTKCQADLTAFLRSANISVCPRCGIPLNADQVARARKELKVNWRALGWTAAGVVPATAVAFVLFDLGKNGTVRDFWPMLFLGAIPTGAMITLIIYGIIWSPRPWTAAPATTPPATTSDEHAIIACPECHQRVRIPSKQGKLVVHCPKCAHAWGWNPHAADQRFEKAAADLRPTACPRCGGLEFSLFEQSALPLFACLACCHAITHCPYCRTRLLMPGDGSEMRVSCASCNESWDLSLRHACQTRPTACRKCHATRLGAYLKAAPSFVACMQCSDTWDLPTQAPHEPGRSAKDGSTDIRAESGGHQEPRRD